MALPSSGPISLNDIDAEFGLGTDLGSYRGVTWYTSAGGAGTFTNSNLGMDQFRGKQANSPVALTYNTSALDAGNKSTYTFNSVSFGTHTSTRLVVIAVGSTNAAYYPSGVSITSATIAGVSASIAVEQAFLGDGGPHLAIIYASISGSTSSGTVIINYNTLKEGCSIGSYNVTDAAGFDANAWSGQKYNTTPISAPLASYMQPYSAVIGLAGITNDGFSSTISFNSPFSSNNWQSSYENNNKRAISGVGAVLSAASNVSVGFSPTASASMVVAAAFR